MAKVQNNNQYQAGDTVWWFDPYENLRNGKITEIKETNQKGVGAIQYATVDLSDNPGTMNTPLNVCWPTKGECLAADMQERQMQCEEYKAGIHDVKDLVKFLYEADINSEFPDHAARDAANAKAMELLGINLENSEDDFSKAVSEIPTLDGDHTMDM